MELTVEELFPGLDTGEPAPKAADVRAGLVVGDEVKFAHKGVIHSGRITKFNPKRAKVYVERWGDWNVPYARLITNREQAPKVDRTKHHKVRTVARSLMDAHGLKDWRFDIDEASRRWGQCDYDRKLITVTHAHVQMSESWDVIETILHEIAHALANDEVRRLGETAHGPTWQRIARRIGGKVE